MHRTTNAFSVLQATAVTVALAILLWSFGLPSFRFAEAANVISYSNTLSNSAPAQASNHTIVFTPVTGVSNGGTITLDFSDGPFVVGSVSFSDIDVETTSNFTLAADCSGSEEVSAAFSGTLLTIELCSGDGASIAANATTTIRIGTNATFQTTGVNRLTNPGAGSYEIPLTAGPDTGETRVAIVPTVLVTASVDTLFQFTVAGVAGGGSINADTTGGTTTATTIPFGELAANTASTAAQDLSVTTNARNGFVVTVQTDQQLSSAIGADIDGFIDGAFTNTPAAWIAPTGNPTNENSWGHWGITTNDATVGNSLSNVFDIGGINGYVSASTTPVEIFRHSGPTNGTGTGQGTTRVGYKVQISALQEAAEDYTATLTYVATPVF